MAGQYTQLVTPFMGVWIEIEMDRNNIIDACVTPFMGVWIEISASASTCSDRFSHTLYGCVD